MSRNEILFRDYQELILEDIFEKFNYKKQLVSALGMGGGKSIIISATAKHYFKQNKNVAILTNISQLIPQLKKHLEELNLPFHIIKSGYELEELQKDDNPKIYLIMEQSFHQNL